MDKNLITNRRREVEAEIERLKISISEHEAELAELDTAERVMARLSGAKWVAPSKANQQEPTIVPPEVNKRERPLTDKIQIVLQEAHRRGLKGLEPKEIYENIIAKGWSADVSAVRSTTWRIWKDGRLSKPDPDSPLYTVPEREKATDLLSRREQSEAFDHQPEQQGREAGPGGGT